MSAALFASVLLVLVLGAGALWVRRQRLSAPAEQADAFAAARAITKRWSEDPATTPEPLKDYLRAQQRIAAGEEPDQQDDDPSPHA